MALLFIAILSTTSIMINGQVTPPLTGWTPTTAPSQSVLPEATSGLVAGYDSITRRIWLLGGFGAGENNIWYYSLEDDTFTDTTNTLPHALGVASVSAQSYTTMGRMLYYIYSNTLQRFDMNTGSYDGSWALANDNTLTYAHASPCIASDDQYIFVIGGDAGTAAGSYTQYYDTVNDLWRQPQNAATGRARQSCAISGDKNTLYQFGGTFDGYSPVSISCGNSCSNIEISVEILDISNKATIDTISATNWELVYDGPSCCGNQYILGNLGNLLYSRAVTLDGYIYIIGGRDRYTNPTDTVTFFDPSRNDNQVQFSVDLNTARSSPAVVVADGSIYVFGGTVSGSSPYTSSWEKSNVLTDAPTPAPTADPTPVPTDGTASPTNATPSPTDATNSPTAQSAAPTSNTESPTTNTESPTAATDSPTANTPVPTPQTQSPTSNTPGPTIDPTKDPTADPTTNPTSYPTSNPSTPSPSTDPTSEPSKAPVRTNHPTTDPTMDPTSAPTAIPTENPSKRPTKAPTTKEPTLKANTGNEPTTGNGQAQDTPTTSPTQPAGAKGADEEESAVLNTTTLIIIGSSVGVCIICILVLLLLVCHRRNKLLNQALNKTISQAEMIDVTASRMGATTNGTTNMPTHYPLNSQSPMVSNSGEIQNYDGRNTGVVPHDDEKDNELIRVVSSSDNVGEMALSEGSNQFRQGTVNSNAASVFLNGSYMNENDSDDNEDNDDLYKKATKGGPMNYETAGGNDDIVTNGAPPKIISNGNNESSEDEDNGMYGKGNNSSKGGTVGGSEWNSFRASD